MFRFVFFGIILAIIVPAFLFGRAVAVVRGIVIGASLWAVFIILWGVGDLLNWFSPSTGWVLLLGFLFFALDILVLSVLASLAVSKEEETWVAAEAAEIYARLPPEAKIATKRVAAAFFDRIAKKRAGKNPGLVADILTEISKSLI